MKKAFTIVELIVVVGIIGILMGILVAAFSGSTESARAAKCQANLKTLAQACYTAAMRDTEYHRYPHAGSTLYASLGSKQVRYNEHKGWISWLCGNHFKGGDTTSKSSFTYAGAFASGEDVNFAITNGALWQAVGENSSCYKCPTILRKKPTMGWSYVMNGSFHYGEDRIEMYHDGKSMGSMQRPDKTLLFAEMCIDDIKSGGNGDYTADCVLEYGGKNRERIGFNHQQGKKGVYAHVAFADGHVERIRRLPKTNEYDLTKWLCLGYNISVDGDRYREDKRAAEAAGVVDDED